jgi:hypothetical protein
VSMRGKNLFARGSHGEEPNHGVDICLRHKNISKSILDLGVVVERRPRTVGLKEGRLTTRNSIGRCYSRVGIAFRRTCYLIRQCVFSSPPLCTPHWGLSEPQEQELHEGVHYPPDLQAKK